MSLPASGNVLNEPTTNATVLDSSIYPATTKEIATDNVKENGATKDTTESFSKQSVKCTNFKLIDENLSTKLGLGKSGRSPTLRQRLSQYGLSLKRFLGFVGPGYLIAVGYLDPGNWATDLSGGSQFGYSLLFIILCSNFMAMLLQSLAVKLGVVSGMDLAQACRAVCPKWGNYILYVLCELAIIACDLAEVIGSAIALNLLLKIPLPWGVALTACDVMLILLVYKDNSMIAARILEAFVMFLVATVGVCFVLELIYSKPDAGDVMKGYLPSSGIFTNGEQLYIAIGIIGATVMPHNLYLHSHLVKLRKNRDLAKLTDEWQSKLETGDLTSSAKEIFQAFTRRTMKLSIFDSTIALSLALFVNSAILIVAAANFYYGETTEEVENLFDAHKLLSNTLGSPAAFFFAFALLIAGQSSTLTATMAGQVVMEGFLGLRIRPWIRRLVTRGLAIIPAMIIAITQGDRGLNGMLIASQVALSCQLPFAVIPLVYFTSTKKVMLVDSRRLQHSNATEEDISTPGLVQRISRPERDFGHASDESDLIDFSNPWWLIAIAIIVSSIIVGLDIYLVVITIKNVINGET